MDRTSAIVTDAGSSTGHMASLAREFRVPTLVGTGAGSHAIAHGTVVTVDARSRLVYAGEVAALERQQVAMAELAPGRMVHAPAYQLLRRVAQHIVPLNLTDPRSPSFAPASCLTLHDLARYVHEKSYEEMFRMGENLGDLRPTCFKLDVFLPIDLYVIDLGGGVSPRAHGQTLRRADVVSPPLLALLEGMLHKDIPRSGARPMDLRGFASIMMRHALTSPESDRTFRDPCYAIVSDRYLNYTARVGYHFSVVDTYCGKTPNKNYISFRFQGGAAEQDRRCRRALAISEILRERGFTIAVKQDLVAARLTRGSRAEIESHLETLGRLLQFVRQLDVAMVHDGSVAIVRDAFLSGRYDLST